MFDIMVYDTSLIRGANMCKLWSASVIDLGRRTFGSILKFLGTLNRYQKLHNSTFFRIGKKLFTSVMKNR